MKYRYYASVRGGQLHYEILRYNLKLSNRTKLFDPMKNASLTKYPLLQKLSRFTKNGEIGVSQKT
jgi:hypothetical protein